MYRLVALGLVGALALAGCSSENKSAEATSSPSASESKLPLPEFTLRTPVKEDVTWNEIGLFASGSGTSVVAAVSAVAPAAKDVKEKEQRGIDAGISVSLDSGDNWSQTMFIGLPGDQYFEGMMLLDEGAVMVGRTENIIDGKKSVQAYAAIAPQPEFQLQVVTLPEQFEGQARLVDAFADDADWTIVGEVTQKGATSETDTFPAIWRSFDQGNTWTKQVVEIEGVDSMKVGDFAIAPDGSLNFFGQSIVDGEADAAWARSTDGGKAFELVDAQRFAAPGVQAATYGTFSSTGSAGILGYDEATGEKVSMVWAASVNGPVTRLGADKVPVAPNTPPGQFLSGVMFDQQALMAWGSTDGVFPSKQVQFWSWNTDKFEPADTMEQEGQLLEVNRFVAGPNTVLAVGAFGPSADKRAFGVWTAPALSNAVAPSVIDPSAPPVQGPAAP